MAPRLRHRLVSALLLLTMVATASARLACEVDCGMSAADASSPAAAQSHCGGGPSDVGLASLIPSSEDCSGEHLDSSPAAERTIFRAFAPQTAVVSVAERQPLRQRARPSFAASLFTSSTAPPGCFSPLRT